MFKKPFLILGFFLALPALSAQISLQTSKAEALSLIQATGGKIVVQNGNYTEADNFQKPLFHQVNPAKIGFYSNAQGQIYCIVYSLKNSADTQDVVSTLAKFPINKDKLMSATEEKGFLQLVMDNEENRLFILMNTEMAQKDGPDDYAVLKKTVQSWQSLLDPFVPKNLLGLTKPEVKAMALGKITYTEINPTEGELKPNGGRIAGYEVFAISVIYDRSGKVIQSLWLFSKPNEWTRFLSIEGRGADLLLQAQKPMQDALTRGETLSTQLDDNTLLRFWFDKDGYGVAFGDAKALLGS